jgi:hypothetical protein
MRATILDFSQDGYVNGANFLNPTSWLGGGIAKPKTGNGIAANQPAAGADSLAAKRRT